ncbi:MAG TPA: DEAD/DEAH box helicase [Polyangiaceae bacterium]|nr:DEAD/DEAH box helicase [Polyangiaceae bacterium]
MPTSDFAQVLGPLVYAALEKKGYGELTRVQEAVLDPELEGRDLRVTSQTGSGKTLAIGFAIRHVVDSAAPAKRGIAHPRALVVAPTRELAKQVEEELAWLYAGAKGSVTSVTGGASYRDEHRALSKGPAVVVGTPGRLFDHLDRGAIDPSGVTAIVLDEADRMLDMGFRDELEAILEKLPEGRRTHLVSATFPRDVSQLADRYQTDPAHVEGTQLGLANADIDHVVHVVEARQRVDALVNLLLANPDAQTLVFAKTRADVARIAEELGNAGFRVSSLSGEMEQAQRNRALAAFKRGDLRVLVATDVAARGIDVQDIARVIHAECPTDPDSYTHRSGRTGRAGRRGTSVVLVTPSGVRQAERVLRRAGVAFRYEPLPSAESIQKSIDERTVAELTGGEVELDRRTLELATRLLEAGDPAVVVGRLLARTSYANASQPRQIRALPKPGARSEDRGPSRDAGPHARGPRRPQEGAARGPRPQQEGFVPFRVTWGERGGADPRRLMAMACRRGGIRGSDIGSIFVEPTHSIVNVAERVATTFARAAEKPDPRDPRVVIQRMDTRAGPPPAAGPEPRRHARPGRRPEPAGPGHFRGKRGKH